MFGPVKAEAEYLSIDSRYGRLAEMQVRIVAPFMLDRKVSHYCKIDRVVKSAATPEAA
jgi:hypothetical protein